MALLVLRYVRVRRGILHHCFRHFDRRNLGKPNAQCRQGKDATFPSVNFIRQDRLPAALQRTYKQRSNRYRGSSLTQWIYGRPSLEHLFWLRCSDLFGLTMLQSHPEPQPKPPTSPRPLVQTQEKFAPLPISQFVSKTLQSVQQFLSGQWRAPLSGR